MTTIDYYIESGSIQDGSIRFHMQPTLEALIKEISPVFPVADSPLLVAKRRNGIEVKEIRLINNGEGWKEMAQPAATTAETKQLTDNELKAVRDLVALDEKYNLGGKLSNYSPMFDRNVYPNQLEAKGMLTNKCHGLETYIHIEYTLTAEAFDIARGNKVNEQTTDNNVMDWLFNADNQETAATNKQEENNVMEFPRKALLNAVKSAGKVIPPRVVQEILKSVVIGPNRVMATDLDTTIIVGCYSLSGAEGRNGGEIVTPYKKLVEVLTAISTDVVTFDTEKKTVNGISIEMFDAQDFPKFYPVVARAGFPNITMEMEAGEMLEILDKVAWAAAGYDQTSVLGAVSINGNNAVATDGSRLSHLQLKSTTAEALLLPADVIIRKLKPLLKGAGKLSLTSDRHSVEIVSNTFTFKTRQIQGEYPRYQELFPAKETIKVTCNDTKGLIANLKLLKAGLDKRLNTIKVDGLGNASNGVDTVRLPIVVNGGEILPFVVNFHYLLQAFESLTGLDWHLDYQGPLKPLAFYDGNYRLLLMPLNDKHFLEKRSAKAS